MPEHTPDPREVLARVSPGVTYGTCAAAAIASATADGVTVPPGAPDQLEDELAGQVTGPAEAYTGPLPVAVPVRITTDFARWPWAYQRREAAWDLAGKVVGDDAEHLVLVSGGEYYLFARSDVEVRDKNKEDA